jgi:hypothetical protein
MPSNPHRTPDRGGSGQQPQEPGRPVVDSAPPATRNRPTQYARVLAVLLEHDEVCGHRTFYGEMMIPRFSAHLFAARRAGFVISKRPCDRHDHEGTAYLYKPALPYEVTLPGIDGA